MLCVSARTIGLCVLGSGESGTIPDADAALVSLCAVRQWLEDSTDSAAVDRVVFAVRTARQHEIFEQLMGKVFPGDG